MNCENKNAINSQPDIDSTFRRVGKNHLKMEKENRVLQKYKESLSKYKNKYGINYEIIFEYPYQFFSLCQDRLYYRPLVLEIHANSICMLFEKLQLPYNSTDECIYALISSLKDILKIMKPLAYRDYVNQYKFKNQINNCFLDFPEEYFKIIDNNLCFINKEKKRAIALTDSIVQVIFKSYNLPISTYFERKKIFYSLEKMAMEGYENTKPDENPYCINYNVNIKNNSRVYKGTEIKQLYKATVRISIEYFKDSRTFILGKNSDDPNYIYKDISISEDSLKPSKSYYPTHFSKLLYTLTGGNIKTIDNLSEIFAYILAARNICNSLTVFYVPEKKELLAKLLGILVGYKVSNMSLKAICDSKNIKNLINLKLMGTFLNISLDSNLPDIENCNILNKILHLKPFSSKDSFLGKKTFINNMHLVYITSKDMNVIKLSNNYSTNIIKLNTTSSDLESLVSAFEMDHDEVEWVQTQFALYGLKRIAEREMKINLKSPQPTTSKAVSSDGFTDFIESCCEVNPKSECYAEEIYKSYTEFYNKYYGGEALSRIHFVKLLKFSGKYKYYRPHHSSEDNRYAFLGISIDQQKLNTAITQNSAKLRNNDGELKVKDYLISMNDLPIKQLT
jgi:hypothetical protein